VTNGAETEGGQQVAATYLGIADGRPFLKGSKCDACGQVYLGERINCAKCAARAAMQPVELSTKGHLYNYTIVYRSYPGITVPFISAIVDLEGGGTVKGNLIDIEPTPDNISFDMPVEVVFRGAELANPAAAGFVAHFFIPAKQGQPA